MIGRFSDSYGEVIAVTVGVVDWSRSQSMNGLEHARHISDKHGRESEQEQKHTTQSSLVIESADQSELMKFIGGGRFLWLIANYIELWEAGSGACKGVRCWNSAGVSQV